MSDTKISEAAVDVAAFAVPAAVPTLEDAKKVVRRVVALYLKHSQPAELAEQQGVDAEEDAYVIDRLGHLLAEIAVVVNGPEPTGTRWSYHDLPEKVRALAATGKQQVGEVPVCNVQGTWLWSKLMDWCKKMGTSPANHDELFAIAKDAQTIYAAQGIDPGPLQTLVAAVEEEFCSPATEEMEPDESKVSWPEENCPITFGMIRAARRALDGQRDAAPEVGA